MKASLGWKLNPLWMFALAIIGFIAITETLAGETPRERLTKAEAMFQERCKTAGEKIYRAVEGVEGIFLMRVRDTTNHGAQFKMDDPYGHDSIKDEYIKSFLYGRDTNGSFVLPDNAAQYGYRYVDADNWIDGKRYRYTGQMEEPWKFDKKYLKGYSRFVLAQIPIVGSPSRFGVTYDDISTIEDRENWIAGSSLKVIDLRTNEVIAERIGYMMDRGQGNQTGGRSPWLLAADYACPSFRPTADPARSPGFSYQIGQTRNFVEKVLKPIQER